MIALDTSFLLAAEGRHEVVKWRLATRVLDSVEPDDLLVPAQALAEMLHIFRTILKLDEDVAAEAAARWLAATRSAPVTRQAIADARHLSARGPLPFDEALMVTAAEEAGATTLLSEDLSPGLRYRGLVVVNPFAPGAQPRLNAMFGPHWAV